MIELVRPIYTLCFNYAQKLLADIADEQMCAQPVPGRVMNHATFTIGHLTVVHDSRAAFLSGDPAATTTPPEWKEWFGMGSKPHSDRSKYPSKDELVAAFEAAHARLEAAAAAVTPETLSAPSPEPMRARFPTVGHLVIGLMTAHYSGHLGQLSAWRRAMGFPSVF